MLKGMLATGAALTVLVGGTFGGIQVADMRYAPMAQFEDLLWSNLRAEIRDLEDRIRRARDPQLRRDLEADLWEYIDRFCRSYPQDRLCGR